MKKQLLVLAAVGSFSLVLCNKDVIKSGPKTNIDINQVLSNCTTDLTIRYIDTMQAMSTSKEGLQIQKELDAKRMEWAKGLEAQAQKLQREFKEFQDKASMMSEASREKEEQRLLDAKRQYEVGTKSREEDFKIAMNKAMAKLGESVRKAAEHTAVAQGVDVVVDFPSGNVIYVSDKAKCTNDIVVAMNSDYGKKTTLASNAKRKPLNQPKPPQA